MPLKTGDTLLNGQYRISSLLGWGGFGAVYHAEDVHLREQVAIKELIPTLAGDKQLLERFSDEARTTMRLRHQRIVATHHAFPESDNYYIVMEYMPGGSLQQRLRDSGPAPVQDALALAIELCDGLSHAHQEGIVHCDLKPANILFAADGTAKIADFGIAHIPQDKLTRTWRTPSGFAAGSLPYMPPEQADGVRADPRVDIFALGAVLYRVLIGRTYLDFEPSDTPGATAENVRRIRNCDPLPPSEHRLEISPDLDQLVLKALSKEPDQRFASAPDFADALAACLELEQARRVTISQVLEELPPDTPVPERLPRWFWPILATAAVLLLLILGGIAALTVPPGPTPTSTQVAVGLVATPVEPTASSMSTPSVAGPPTIPTAAEPAGGQVTEELLPSDTPTPALAIASRPPSDVDVVVEIGVSSRVDQPTAVKPTDTPSPIPPPPAHIFDDFEAYGSNGALEAVYTINAAHGANAARITLCSPPFVSAGARGASFYYEIRHGPPSDYAGFERSFEPQNWNRFKHLILWVKSDGSPRDIVIQIRERNGEVWRHRVNLSTFSEKTFRLRLDLDTFSWADWSPWQNGRFDLAAIDYLGVYVGNGGLGSGTIYVDAIKLR